MKARRRKPSAAARIRPFWLLIGVAGVLAAAGLVALAAWPGFFPEGVTVVGNHRVSRAEILARAAIAARESIWIQSTGAMARRIERIPYIGTAAVHRIPPASLQIVVTERTPFADLRGPGGDALADRDLRVLEPAGEPTGLPIFIVSSSTPFEPGSYVANAQTLRLRDAYERLAAHGILASQLQVDRFGGLIVTIRGGMRLLLGDGNDLDRKIVLANAILAQVVPRQRRVAAIDLRAPAAPVLVYR